MKLLTSTLTALTLTLTLTVRAQTDTNTPSTNPLLAVLQNTIIDTNSTFFDSATLELRALTQTSLSRYESVLSGTYYVNNHFGIGAEIVNGALNVVDAGYLTIEYAVPYHNIKFRPILGIGYDLTSRGAAVEVGGALEVALSKNMFADTEALLQVPFRTYDDRNITGTFRLGLGWKF